MKEYEVMRPWHGVKAGEKFKTEQLHPALKSHVREVSGQSDGELTPSTPDAASKPAKAK